MKKLSREETISLNLKHGLNLFRQQLELEMEQLQVGESILLTDEEWTWETMPSSAYFNKIQKEKGSLKRFLVRRLQDGKSFAFVRLKDALT